MQAQLITGGIAAVGFLIVVIGAAVLASRLRFRQRAGTAEPSRSSPAMPARGTGCVAWALILIGGLIFVVAVLTLAAIAK